MSTGNAHQTHLDDQIEESGPAGRLEDAEIQRLVELSRDASFQQSDRVPVKTFAAFEPKSLVSIAMAAQRRREAEIKTALAAGAVIEEDPSLAGEVAGELAGEVADHQEGDLAAQPETVAEGETPQGVSPEGASPEGASPEGASPEGEMTDGQMGDTEAGAPVEEGPSKSQVDFEAGRAEGVEEGRKVGFDEGMAKGTEEGRAAGRAEASAQLERAMQAFEAATAKLSELTAIDSSALADSINNAIISLASERAGLAIASQPDGFADRIEALLATIRTVSGQPSIRLNPGDLASIQPLAETREKLRHCNFVADPALASGDLSVMVGTIGIDDIIGPDADETPADAAPVAAATPVEDPLVETSEPTASAEAKDNADD